jgi:Ca2+-binding RTX toxin-like protein
MNIVRGFGAAIGVAMITAASALPTVAHRHCVVTPGPENATAKSFVSKAANFVSGTHSVATINTTASYAYSNNDPLKEVTNAYYTRHADSSDFLFVFTAFQFPVPDGAGGYYVPVKNDVTGINMPSIDYTAAFGSKGKLQGVINMLWTTQFTFNRTDPKFLSMMKIGAHELMHRFGPDVAYLDAGGVRKTDLTNPINKPHWSYALDTDASIMYGARWTLDAGSTYKATQTFERLSPLDLYVAGWAPSSSVPPIKLLQLPTLPALNVPAIGTAQATTGVVTVPIAQIIAAEGARMPAFPNAQRQYRASIILVIQPGQTVNAETYDQLEVFRTAFEDYFDAITSGRASIRFARVELSTQPSAPLPINAAAPNGSNGLAQASAWLDSRAGGVMPIKDRDATAIRDTLVTYLALMEAKPTSTNIARALTWLKQAPLKSADAAAAILAADPSHSAALAKLLQANTGARFALTGDHASTRFDSVLAASALARVSSQTSLANSLRTELGSAAIGYTESGQARLVPTIQSAIELARSPANAAQLSGLLTFIRGKYQTDGSFLEGGERNVLAAALVLQHGIALQFTAAELDAIETKLKAQQQFGGDIAGSVYLTAQAVLGFEVQNRPDLSIAIPGVVPAGTLYAGEVIPLRIALKNGGKSIAAASKIALALKQVDGSYLTIPGTQVDVPAISVGATSVQFTLSFDTTGKTGAQELAIVADSENAVKESTETNNRQLLTITVSTPPAQPELSVGASTVVPSIINTLPQSIELATSVKNVGTVAAANVTVGLYRVSGTTLTLVSEQTKNVPASGSEAVTFSFNQSNAAARDLAIIVDRANTVAEPNENNNRRDLSLVFASNTDIQALAANLVFAPVVPAAGDTLVSSIKVENKGTLDVANLRIEYYYTFAGARALMGSQTIASLAAGAEQIVSFQALQNTPGALKVEFLIDPQNAIAESNETNNLAEKTVTIGLPVPKTLTEWDDSYTGTLADETVIGAGGNDAISGNGGNDDLSGGRGNDNLTCSGMGTCRLDGGAENDYLNCHGSGAVCIGGIGDDQISLQGVSIRMQYALGDGKDVANALVSATIQLGAGLTPQNVAVKRVVSAFVFTMPDGGELRYNFIQQNSSVYFPEVKFADGTVWSTSYMESAYPATFTEGADTTVGTAAVDTYAAGAGDDTLFGRVGNDTLRGGAGDDNLFGEQGADQLYGDMGNDSLNDSDGANVLYGGDGHDSVSGSGTLYGEEGNDYLTGSPGAETLDGGEGRDRLLGGNGDDELIGGPGMDRLEGGLGVDRYRYALGDGTDTIVDTGSNTLLTTIDPLVVDVIYVDGEWFFTIRGRDSEQIRARGINRVEFSNGTIWTNTDLSARAVNRTGAADTQTDTAADNILTIDHVGDQISGIGGGTDTVQALIDYRLPTGLEKLELIGQLAINLQGGGEFNSTARGNTASNVFGTDSSVSSAIRFEGVANGGAGDDLYLNVVGAYENADEGNDELVVSDFPNATHSSDYFPTAGNGASDSNIEKYSIARSCQQGYYSSNPNRLYSICERGFTSANDTIDGRALTDGSTVLDGRSGADTYFGGRRIYGYVVDDTGDRIFDDGSFKNRIYSSVDYALPASFEELILFGNKPITATGSNETDFLQGNLNPSKNTLRGGLGDDYYAAGFNDELIELAGEGSDSLVVDSDWTLDAAKSIENVVMIAKPSNAPTSAVYDWHAIGTPGANRLLGNSGSNRLDGGAGDDELIGDVSNLSYRNDRLYGGAGNDRLSVAGYANGGFGNDEIDNAAWVDYAKGDGQDRLSKVSWLRVSGYGASELARRRDEKALILENTVNGDRITIADYFANAALDQTTTIEFGDGAVHRFADYIDLMPVTTIALESVTSSVGQSVTLRLKVKLGPAPAAISKVEFIVYGSVAAIDTTAPYEFTVPSQSTAGSVAVTARATMASASVIEVGGGVTFSATGAPTVGLNTLLTDERALRNQVFKLQALAIPVLGRTISKVEFLVDGTVINTDTAAPYEFDWTVGAAAAYQLTARATDSAGTASTTAVGTLKTFAISLAPKLQFTEIGPSYSGVSQTIKLDALASTGRTITKVELYAGTMLIATDTAAPYEMLWTPTSIVTLTAYATDSSGDVSAGASQAISISPAQPTLTIARPGSASTWTQNLPVQIVVDAKAVGTRTVSKVEFFVNGVLIGQDSSIPYERTWDPTALGAASITAKVTDSTGLAATSAATSVTIVAPEPAPTVSISAPAAGSAMPVNVATEITAAATAALGRTIARVEFYANNTLLGSDLTAPYSLSWTPIIARSYEVMAIAYDSAGISASSALRAITANATGAAPSARWIYPAAGSEHGIGGEILLFADAVAGTGQSISKVEFFNGATLIGTDATKPYTLNWSVTGSANLTAKATDSQNTAGVSDVLAIRGVVADATPERMDFRTIKAQPNTVVTSQAMMLLGTNVPIPSVQVTGGEYSLAGVSRLPGGVDLGGPAGGTSFGPSNFSVPFYPTQSIRLRGTAPAVNGQKQLVKLSLGGVESTLVIEANTDPNDFAHDPIPTEVARTGDFKKLIESQPMAVTGFDGPLFVTTYGQSEYSIDGAPYTNRNSRIFPNSIIRLRALSGERRNQVTGAAVYIGRQTTEFLIYIPDPTSPPPTN